MSLLIFALHFLFIGGIFFAGFVLGILSYSRYLSSQSNKKLAIKEEQKSAE